MVMKLEQDVAAIREAFAQCNLEVVDDAIPTCASICSEFNLTADELAARWDAFSMNHQVLGAADEEKLGVFRAKLAQDKKEKEGGGSGALGAAGKRKHGKISGTPVIKREVADSGALSALYSMKSPEGKPPRGFASPTGKAIKAQRTASLFSPTSVQSPPGNSYEKRTDAGKTVSEFNIHLMKQVEVLLDAAMVDTDANSNPVEVKIAFPGRNLQRDAPYMYTPLFDRAIALNNQLEEYETIVKTHFNIEELQPIGDPSPAQVTVVGRIVCEAAEGKLNPSVVQIEGSRKTCGGQRVPLDLTHVPNFEVFPGKLVAVEGVFEDARNPFVVKRILEPIPAPMPTTNKAQLESLQIDQGRARPLNVVTACGPFTTTNNIAYLPLHDLLQIVKNQKPDVLILTGPFIDGSHASFQEGVVEFDNMMVSFDDIFLFKIMATIDNVLEAAPQLQIVLIPSPRDAHHEYVYPQPPFDKKKACEALGNRENAKRVHMMPNPCTFSINGVVFGVSTLDVVMHLSSSELYHRSQGRDQNRLLRLCQQVVDQRSYYPIFPPPTNAEAPLDLRYMQQYQFEQTPDVLVLPSMLNRFCGRVQDSLCINPGQLCKSESGGTFAVLTILPLSSDQLAATAGDESAHLIPDRTMAVIKRI